MQPPASTSSAVGNTQSLGAPPNPPDWKRGFWGLFVTQFQGAFSDNVFKWLVTFLIVGTLEKTARDRLVPLVGILFAIPFLLFSMWGGYLADRHSKRNVAIATKLAEIVIMLLATLGLWLNHVPLLLGVVFLMSAQSAFFGPAKYGLLPELLPEKQLSWGNGILGLGTFVAIIAGTVLAGILSDAFGQKQFWSGWVLVALAMIGTTTSLAISRVAPADPTRPFRAADLIPRFGDIRSDRVLFLSILGMNYFWFIGALLQLAIVFYGKDLLLLSDTQSGYLQAALAIGIGVGSFAAGYFSGNKIEFGLVPIGALGLTLFTASIGLFQTDFKATLILLALLGFSGGFYIIPLEAMIQHRPERERKGSVIAVSAFLSFVGIFIASGVYYFLTSVIRFEPPQIFVAGALMALGGTGYVLYLLPDAFLRFVLWCLTHSLYRIQVAGRDNIPEKGGALFVCNHLSLADALLLQASTDRPIRFLMFKGMYDRPWIKPFARLLRAIPISAQLRPREMIRSLQEASQAIKAGEVVCIFAEGQITRIGQLLPFRRGFERIMKDVQAPIIPVSLEGVWGSIFSFEKGRFLWKLPRRIPYPVTVNYGSALPHDASPFVVRQAVQDLNSQAWKHRKKRMAPLQRRFVHTARKHPRQIAMIDQSDGPVSFGGILVRTIRVARQLRKELDPERDQRVGILLPNSVSGAIANLSILLMGKAPVNLNAAFSPAALESCLRQAEIRTVISSRQILNRLQVPLSCRVLLMEDLFESANWIDRCCATLAAIACPARILERWVGRRCPIQLDDPATLLFTLDRPDQPLGVALTHFNIGANVDQLGQTFGLGRRDSILGTLPFSNPFGFTGTLCLPAIYGVGVVYFEHPLDAKAVGEFVLAHRITVLLATPSVLETYIRGCAPEQFGSLQFVLVGGEKLSETLSRAFEERFGLRPLEAYGCAECGPVVAVNTRDFRAPGFRQVGAKQGKIGHPLPGVSVRIVDPNTRAELGPGQPGLLLVRGPNIAPGYLGQADRTAAFFQNGWFNTGLLAVLDEDGFLEVSQIR